ncbi:MAG: hypothetical protein QOE70_1471 [Chthoniobacter sp.]|nr:hypothetical protein [Chthoniobacter sp.]
MISPGRLWWLLRRDFRRGWKASYHAYRTLPHIVDWSGVPATGPLGAVPVHVLTGANDWRLAAWMLASWFHFTEQAWTVVIHDDGTLPDTGSATLTRLFPNLRVVTRAEADVRMEKALRPFPFCHEYRQMHPLALKIFDFPHFAEGARYLVFDSDLLFFNHPREILDWVQAGHDECWFNEDVADAALITATEARDDFGIRLWQRVNSGLGLIAKAALDHDFMDSALAQTSILRGTIWRIEQTLYALCASRHGKGGLLPRRYEVSLGKEAAEDAVSRHYVGAVRDRFFGEGLARLRRELFVADHP